MVGGEIVVGAGIGDGFIGRLLAKELEEARMVQNQIAHVRPPCVLIGRLGLFAGSLPLDLVIAGYRHNISAVFHQTSDHSAPEGVLNVELHQVGADNARNVSVIRRNNGVSVTHDHIAIKEKET